MVQVYPRYIYHTIMCTHHTHAHLLDAIMDFVGIKNKPAMHLYVHHNKELDCILMKTINNTIRFRTSLISNYYYYHDYIILQQCLILDLRYYIATMS